MTAKDGEIRRPLNENGTQRCGCAVTGDHRMSAIAARSAAGRDLALLDWTTIENGRYADYFAVIAIFFS